MIKALPLLAAVVLVAACSTVPATTSADATRACETMQDPRLEAICVAQEKARSEADAS